MGQHLAPPIATRGPTYWTLGHDLRAEEYVCGSSIWGHGTHYKGLFHNVSVNVCKTMFVCFKLCTLTECARENIGYLDSVPKRKAVCTILLVQFILK